MSEPEPAVGEPRAQVGKEIGRDLLTTETVAVMLIGCELSFGTGPIGPEPNDRTRGNCSDSSTV